MDLLDLLEKCKQAIYKSESTEKLSLTEDLTRVIQTYDHAEPISQQGLSEKERFKIANIKRRLLASTPEKWYGNPYVEGSTQWATVWTHVDDDDSVARRFRLAQNMSGEDDGFLFSNLSNNLPDFNNLVGIETRCGFIQN